MYPLKILISPKEFGFIECNYCGGLGSLDKIKQEHVMCSVCKGNGILKIKSNKDLVKKNKVNNIFVNQKRI